jgi:hypothetical protein
MHHELGTVGLAALSSVLLHGVKVTRASLQFGARLHEFRNVYYMSNPETPVTYSALRVSSRSSARVWWTAAARRQDTPHAIASLLGGRKRVEVTRDEAVHALAWAAGISGWPAAGPTPVFLHEPA